MPKHLARGWELEWHSEGWKELARQGRPFEMGNSLSKGRGRKRSLGKLGEEEALPHQLWLAVITHSAPVQRPLLCLGVRGWGNTSISAGPHIEHVPPGAPASKCPACLRVGRCGTGSE